MSVRSLGQVGLLFVCEALTRTASMMVLMSMALGGRLLAPTPVLATLPLALVPVPVPVAMTITTIPAAQMMRRRGRRIGFQLAAMIGIGGATTCAAAVWLQSFALLCVGTFAAIGVVQALILVVVTFTRLPLPVADDKQEGGRGLRQLAANPTFVMAVLGAVASWGLMSLLMNATPLSMERHHHSFGDTAQVIQWHVLGMYVPAFFTGSLVRRFGERPILFLGLGLIGLSTALNLLGLDLIHYMAGLTVLGMGWNFLFVACTTLLIGTYRGEAEKAKVQSVNDFLIFATMILSTFAAGPLEDRIGWFELNQAAAVVTAVVAVVLVLLVWRERQHKARLVRAVKG